MKEKNTQLKRLISDQLAANAPRLAFKAESAPAIMITSFSVGVNSLRIWFAALGYCFSMQSLTDSMHKCPFLKTMTKALRAPAMIAASRWSIPDSTF